MTKTPAAAPASFNARETQAYTIGTECAWGAREQLGSGETLQTLREALPGDWEYLTKELGGDVSDAERKAFFAGWNACV